MASDHTAPPSQEGVVKELQSEVHRKIESEAACPPAPAPEAAKGQEKPKAEPQVAEVEAVPPEKPDEVKEVLLSGDKPVVEPPTEELVNKDKPVVCHEAREHEAEVACVSAEAAAVKPEDKQVEVPKDDVQQKIRVATELSGPPAEKAEDCKIVHEQSPAEVETTIEDVAAIAKKVPAPDESTGSEPADVDKRIEVDSSISEEKPVPEPAGKENVDEPEVEPVVEVSPKKAAAEPAEREVGESIVEIESQERSEPEKKKAEESKVTPVDVTCEAHKERNEELPTEVVEPIEAACKPEVALVEQAPEVDDNKLLKEEETSTLVGKAATQGDLPRELADEPTEVKGSSEDKVSGPKAEDLVPCDEKVTEDAIKFTPEPRELAAETVEPAKVEPKAEEKSVVAKELLLCAEKPDEAVINPAPPSQPAEKSGEASRDFELEAEHGKNKDATKALAETGKDVETHEGKENKEVIKEKSEAECKAEETVQPIAAKTEEERLVDEPAKRDIQQSECNKDIDETKTTTEAHKGDVKPQKQSIVKMVKQSLVKAKKAIIGKSHNSKTTASEAKDSANN